MNSRLTQVKVTLSDVNVGDDEVEVMTRNKDEVTHGGDEPSSDVCDDEVEVMTRNQDEVTHGGDEPSSGLSFRLMQVEAEGAHCGNDVLTQEGDDGGSSELSSKLRQDEVTLYDEVQTRESDDVRSFGLRSKVVPVEVTQCDDSLTRKGDDGRSSGLSTKLMQNEVTLCVEAVTQEGDDVRSSGLRSKSIPDEVTLFDDLEGPGGSKFHDQHTNTQTKGSTSDGSVSLKTRSSNNSLMRILTEAQRNLKTSNKSNDRSMSVKPVKSVKVKSSDRSKSVKSGPKATKLKVKSKCKPSVAAKLKSDITHSNHDIRSFLRGKVNGEGSFKLKDQEFQESRSDSG